MIANPETLPFQEFITEVAQKESLTPEEFVRGILNRVNNNVLGKEQGPFFAGVLRIDLGHHVVDYHVMCKDPAEAMQSAKGMNRTLDDSGDYRNKFGYDPRVVYCAFNLDGRLVYPKQPN